VPSRPEGPSGLHRPCPKTRVAFAVRVLRLIRRVASAEAAVDVRCGSKRPIELPAGPPSARRATRPEGRFDANQTEACSAHLRDRSHDGVRRESRGSAKRAHWLHFSAPRASRPEGRSDVPPRPEPDRRVRVAEATAARGTGPKTRRALAPRTRGFGWPTTEASRPPHATAAPDRGQVQRLRLGTEVPRRAGGAQRHHRRLKPSENVSSPLPVPKGTDSNCVS